MWPSLPVAGGGGIFYQINAFTVKTTEGLKSRLTSVPELCRGCISVVSREGLFRIVSGPYDGEQSATVWRPAARLW